MRNPRLANVPASQVLTIHLFRCIPYALTPLHILEYFHHHIAYASS